MPRLLPTLAAFAASFLLGAVPFLSVHLYAAGLNPQSLLFLRYWLALTLLIPFAALWCRQKIETAVSQAGLILWIDAAVLGTVQTYCYFEALRRGPSSIAVVGLFCFPPITLAIERMIGRRVELADVGSSAVVLAGAVAAVSPVINGDLHLDGILYAFATPCFYSVYLLIAAPRMRELDPLIATILLYLGLGAGFALIVCTTGLALPHNAQQWGYMAVIAMFGGAIATTLITFSMPRLGPSGYGIVATSEVLTVVAFGTILLGEHINRTQLIGIVVMCTGILLYALRRARIVNAPA